MLMISEDDFLICHGNNEEISHGIKGFKGRQILIDKYLSQEGIFVQEAMVTVCFGKPLVLDHHVERQVLGHHNLVNMATGILCARILGHENQDLELNSFLAKFTANSSNSSAYSSFGA